MMESGKTAEQGNGLPHTPTARQAKRAGPKLEAGAEASAMRKAGKASPARDERLANLEQRDPRSGDAKGLFVYHLFRKQMLPKQEHGGPRNDRLH
ncbi:hypothetical protein Ajs_2638 [Acidovorax sp. JS42]|nr:hypothetical protein Ajs_2638 [Acidovorax sp. JS42]